jgi:hypothetical protein
VVGPGSRRAALVRPHCSGRRRPHNCSAGAIGEPLLLVAINGEQGFSETVRCKQESADLLSDPEAKDSSPRSGSHESDCSQRLKGARNGALPGVLTCDKRGLCLLRLCEAPDYLKC